LLDGLPDSLLDRTLDWKAAGTVVQEASFRASSPESRAILPSIVLPSLVPARVRRSSGAFYTPAWLARLALEQVGWPSSSKSIIDPTCGTGVFLACAALSLRNVSCCLTDAAARIAGADTDPVAVLGARVACLCAVADLLAPGQPFEPDIRVANLFAPSPFPSHGIVVGNPPWIRFSDINPLDRACVAKAAHHYGLVPRSGFHGGTQLDLSAVCAYRMLDAHLAPFGHAALLLPSSLLRSASAAGFRRFVLPDGTPLQLNHIMDFGTLRVFPNAVNRTSLLCWTRGMSQRPQIRAQVATARSAPSNTASFSEAIGQLGLSGRVARFVGLTRTITCLSTDVPACLEGACTHVRGRKGITTDLNGAYFIRILGSGSGPGLVSAANDVTSRGTEIPSHVFDVEEELVFPLLKGARSIRRFGIDPPDIAVILPNRTVNRIPDESAFATRYPSAYAHFCWVERETKGSLSARSSFKRMLAHSQAPFFSVYNVGDYTFAPFKVVWAEIARTLVAGIATSCPLTPLEHSKVVVPDHKVYFAPFDEIDPALFLCAMLNSAVVRSYVDAITEKLQVGALLDRVCLPPYDADNGHHQALVEIAAREFSGVGVRESSSMASDIDSIAFEILRDT